MAECHVAAFSKIAGVKVVAGIDTRGEQLAQFNAKHHIPKGFSSIKQALEWGEFDAVSNVTPDAVHYSITMPLLAEKKHILCEKPLATNATHAANMAIAAREAGVINMVNLSYRHNPALQKAAYMVRHGDIGRIRFFEASYLQSWLTQSAWGNWKTDNKWLWRLSSQHGSRGVLGDVGIHILDFTTFAAGQDVREISCRLATFDKIPGGQIGEYSLDANDTATMQVILANNALGTITASRFATGHLNDLRLRIYGDKGGLDISFENKISRLRACLSPDQETAKWRDIVCPEVPQIYQNFIDAIRTREKRTTEPDFARGAELQKILDTAVESSNQLGVSLKIQ
jgi:predicted dehydrogenase